MRIGLINENSQAQKNNDIYRELSEVAKRNGHEVLNFGMYSSEDSEQLTYVQVGIMAAILLNSGVVDFIVTGCGTGEGAMLACNSFPGVICGHVVDPSDSYMFMQINNGNAISLPFAKGYGWGAELNLRYIFERLFDDEPGGGYPKERAIPEQRNKKILDDVKSKTYRPLIDILKDLDQELVKGAISTKGFNEYFEKYAKNKEIIEYINSIK